MSLSIDSRFITGVYALGQWFNVTPNTVDVDAYEFINWEEELRPEERPSFHETQATCFCMGSVYPTKEDQQCGSYGQSRMSWANPMGLHGFTFIDADTGERVCFSLTEIRAFRERRV